MLINCGESGKKKKKETGGEVSVLMSSGVGSSTSLPVAVGGSQFDPIGETLKVNFAQLRNQDTTGHPCS